MGDFRADIKITMTLLGKTYKYDCWINYNSYDDGVDERVRAFFSDAWEDAQTRYADMQWESNRAEEARETEQRERRQLEILKAKYEGGERQ